MTFQADAFNPSSVNFQLVTPIVNPLAINNSCLVSDNNIVRPAGTIKAYTQLSDVIADYGTTAPETIFATPYFGSGLPTNYLIFIGIENTYPLSSISVLTPGSTTTDPLVTVFGTGEGAVVQSVEFFQSINTIQTSGQNFLVGDQLSPIGGVSTETAVLTVATLQLNNFDILDGGLGNSGGDIITMAGGTFSTACQIEVLTVDGSGAVLTASISVYGDYTVPSASLTQGSTTGSGTGFSLQSCLFGIRTVTVTTPGAYTVLPLNSVHFQTITGSGVNFTADLNWGVSELNVITPGEGYDDTTLLVFGGVTGTPPTYTINLASTGFVASTLNTGYQAAVSQGYGGFTWCNFVNKACSPAWGSISQTIDELNQIQTAAISNKTKWAINILSDDEDSLNNTPGCLAKVIAQQQYNDKIRVSMMGYSNFSSDPSLSNKRIDAFVSSLKASISLATYEFSGPQAILYRNNTSLCTPIPIGQTDGYGINWTESKFNSVTSGVPNGQLILFGQSGNQRVLAFGFILNNLYNVSLDSVAIALYLEQYLNNVLRTLFTPPTVPNYNPEGNAAGYTAIINALKQFSDVGMIGPNFSCTLPALNYNTPVPRILGPYTVSAMINGVAYGIVTNGILTA